ncbi:hypothetical protein MCOR27_006430 [Pyricularia oryzae]|uniref:1,3-beta-glucanosyltransferase n=3 Tax=Pyricularia TaxID=48558 RepID=A0ABQ8NHI4_PYRGI|nr:1,3-beta-glucanosyltransferase gel4 [Pyricularia oryzae 70-15]KAH8842355.1 hypothetical protein MCOR01_006264 [Pyricularia oryzae]KAI6297200.1 hypothetical protein MCOR33_006401 [Pyricularia grisea]EHA56882.1 1,3-beta-glucanosyltransferase gel4 [Pyricularia oryzae 70-15]KAH9435589.1 hypothetical protein MCOR02_004513 [Pyricularia oryzae]KAI6258898.1 hypothetical protein MCOR19_004741 [Pyricularia oryzae]
MGFTKSSLISAALLASQASATLQPIVKEGNKFFYENGTQFYMKGIAYQQAVGAAGAATTQKTFVDPLADEKACKRDIPNLQKAGTNTIRVYQIDPTANHDACMKMLDDAGIYVIADLGEPSTSIDRENPEWNTKLYDRYKAVVDVLAKYTNTIGFFSGNEVTNQANNTMASAYVKAATRDTKKYIKQKGYRWMGVGYATNDDKDIRDPLAAYFNCGDQDAAIDYWGYNIYSWCGDSDFTKSQYDQHIKNFASYSVPVFLAEYGCIDGIGGAEGRKWTETTALYSDRMTGTFSGGIVYMYFQEDNDYGLFKASANGGGSTMKNFDALVNVMKDVNPKTIEKSSFTSNNKPLDCPGIQSNWLAASALPPTPDQAVCECMTKSATCAPSSSLSEKDYGEIFSFICGAGDSCKGINGNATTGQYGAFHGCDSKSKLTYALDQYYKSQRNSATACDFKGKATVVTPQQAASTCSSLLSAATAAADKANAGAGSGSDTSKNAASSFRAPGGLAQMALGMYVAAAVGVGATMFML